MKIKAKQIFIVGAFIVLTLIGYIILPKDEIVIDLKEEYENNSSDISGEEELENKIYVHIEGAVNTPGIKIVEKGTRLFEVIEIADGALDDADLSKINLASVLKDEQKINIPYKADIEPKKLSETEKNNLVDNNSLIEFNDLININVADINELQQLDGIGPSMAEKIVNYREENGYFNSIEDIKSVGGIGEAKFNKIKDKITI